MKVLRPNAAPNTDTAVLLLTTVELDATRLRVTAALQTSSVYADDYSTATSSSAEHPVASSTGKYPAESSSAEYSVASSTADYPVSSTADYPVSSPTPDSLTTLASSVRPASSTPCTTSSIPSPTPSQPVSKNGKCGGDDGQTCAG